MWYSFSLQLCLCCSFVYKKKKKKKKRKINEKEEEEAKRTPTTNERKCLRTERGRVRRVEHGTLTFLVFTCTGDAGPSGTHFIKIHHWRQRSRTRGTCPTVKPLDGCAAHYLLRSFAPKSCACVEAAGRSRVCQFNLQLAQWGHLIGYLCHNLFLHHFLLLSFSMSSLVVL